MTEVVVDIEAVIGQFEKYDDEIRRLKQLYTEAEVKAAAHLNEIERLREALRYYAKNHYPDIDAGPWGPNSNDWGDVARSALGEKE